MLRTHTFFFDENPAPSEVLSQLNSLTGAELALNQISENCIDLCVKDTSNVINVNWVSKRRIEEHKQVLGKSFVVPFPDKKHYVKVSSEESKPSYIELSLVYLLRKIGGQEIEAIVLPKWAGRKFAEIERKGLNQWFNWLALKFKK